MNNAFIYGMLNLSSVLGLLYLKQQSNALLKLNNIKMSLMYFQQKTKWYTI